MAARTITRKDEFASEEALKKMPSTEGIKGQVGRAVLPGAPR